MRKRPSLEPHDPPVIWPTKDGLCLQWAGQVHWLTCRESASFRLGVRSVEDIACRVWPDREQWLQ